MTGTLGEIRWFTVIEEDAPIQKRWGAYRLGKLLHSIQPIHMIK